MLKRVHFPPSILPYLLVAPQVAITLIFFIWPATEALYQSLLIEDAFGLSTEFVWFENFSALFKDPQYTGAFVRTAFFSGAVAFLSLSLAIVLAGFADRVVRAATVYRTLLIWPYAIVASILFIIGAAIATVVVAVKHPVEMSDMDMQDYHHYDANANDIISAKIAFDRKVPAFLPSGVAGVKAASSPAQ